LELGTITEEMRGLLRLILEGQAYRQLMLCHIRGHGVKFVPEIEGKLELARALDDSLGEFRDVQQLYQRLGQGDLLSAVRRKMDRVPYPESRMELAVCLFLCERVQHLALSTYVESECEELAEIARERLETNLPDEPSDPAFLEFCEEASNRPGAQEIFNRWLAVTLVSIGRPNSERDARAVELHLRSRRAGDVTREYLEGLAPFMERAGLERPRAETIGIEMPEESR
jgi:1,2-phenylacetyl-CoA epoxidase catalytic subunit